MSTTDFNYLNNPFDIEPERSDLKEAEQYRELEQIYNKLVVTNRRSNYGLPMQHTFLPSHARKLGIRLKTAKHLSETSQSSDLTRKRLKTADPRLMTQREVVPEMPMEDVTIVPLHRDVSMRDRAVTALQTKPSKFNTSMRTPVIRKGTKSAPPDRSHKDPVRQSTRASQSHRPITCRGSIPVHSSLAMYSPQTQRFTIEQLAQEQTRLLKRLSNIQTHRVDKGFLVSGAPCNLRDRYKIDEDQYQLLMEITNKGRQVSQNMNGLSLSQSIMQHLSLQHAMENGQQDLMLTSRTLSMAHKQSKSHGAAKRVASLISPKNTTEKVRTSQVAFQEKTVDNDVSSHKRQLTTPEYDVEREYMSPAETALVPADQLEVNGMEDNGVQPMPEPAAEETINQQRTDEQEENTEAIHDETINGRQRGAVDAEEGNPQTANEEEPAGNLEDTITPPDN